MLTLTEALDPLRRLRRPARPHTARRTQSTPMPLAWSVLWSEHFGVERPRVWNAWQALSSTKWSEPRALAQQITLWSYCPEHVSEFASRGLTPTRLMLCIELLVIEGRLSPGEASTLETHLLAHVGRNGQWH